MGLWLNAASLAKTTAIEDIVKGFDSNESSSIRVVKELFSHSSSRNLAYIKSNVGAISSTVAGLKVVDSRLRDSLDQSLCRAPSVIGQAHDNLKTYLKDKAAPPHVTKALEGEEI
jgi:hypothetical protein